MCSKLASKKMLRLGRPLWLVAALFLTVLATAARDPIRAGDASISSLEIPRILAGQRAAAALVRIGELKQAEDALNRLTESYPSLAVLHYELAIVLLRENQTDGALQSLARAVAAGLPSMALEQNSVFDPLRANETFQKLVAEAKAAPNTQAHDC